MTRKGSVLERLAYWAARWTGTSWAFALALGAILAWAITGPLFGFSDTWQLVINTSTTIVTFLMVFLIQRSQNKDACAIQLKLNELVAVVHGTSNRLINVEDLSEKEVESLHKHYHKLVELAKREDQLSESHSIEEAEDRHRSKQGSQRQASGQQAKDEGQVGRSRLAAPAMPCRGRNDSSAPPDDFYSQSNGLARGEPGVNGTHTRGLGEAGIHEDELAQFLAAAASLQDRIHWHQRSLTEMKEALARHGVRLKPLSEAPAARNEPGEAPKEGEKEARKWSAKGAGQTGE